MRLDRILANSGHGSRKTVRELIRSGRVSLDGRPLTRADEGIADAALDRLELDGRPLNPRFSFYFALNKPAGYLSAMEDSRIPCVAVFLPPELLSCGLFPVGRLDLDTTGLLLFTNDGRLGHRLCGPEWHVEKRYRLTYSGRPFSEDDAALLAEGLLIQDLRCRPARLEFPEETDPEHDGPLCTAYLTLTEGKYHQVKRMVSALGRELQRLNRESHGPVTLDGIESPGAVRPLTDAEIDALYQAADLTRPTR